MITGYLLSMRSIDILYIRSEWTALLYFLFTFATLSFSPSLSFTTTHGSRLTPPPLFYSFLSLPRLPLNRVSHLYHNWRVPRWISTPVAFHPVSLCLNLF